VAGLVLDLQIDATLLHVASKKGRLPVVMALLERGADVAACDTVRLQREHSDAVLRKVITLSAPRTLLHL
jgi:hypothetical protein